MTLTVETGAGLALADSYISVEDADAYHGGRNNNAWFALELAAKEGALRQATAYLDGTYTWVGYLKTTTQALSWPRIDAYDNQGRLLASDAVPLKVEQATAYLALQGSETALQPTVEAGSGGAVKRRKVASLEIEFFEGGTVSTDRKFSEADTILRGLYVGSRGGISGNVVRWS